MEPATILSSLTARHAGEAQRDMRVLHDPDDFAACAHGRFLIDRAVAKLAGLHLGTCERLDVAADGSLRRCGDTGVRTRSATVPKLFYVFCPRHGGDPERGMG